eukprot:NODE_30727_length_411_cov_2.387324.p3 GENE.NODE_30727_length_411_cov_2.387324~~NODE_30727_length_411_cov_2.387324.p3  ORF type:complete len:53 (+),score=5.41 NODE_30727_length_411_cov_2.387324:210-368(+)
MATPIVCTMAMPFANKYNPVCLCASMVDVRQQRVHAFLQLIHAELQLPLPLL